MKKSKWNNEAVKAYESGQGVVLVEKPYPHYEPVACLPPTPISENALYTDPPQRTWVGLTDEDKDFIVKRASVYDWHDYEVIEATEAKLKQKNSI